MEVCEKLELAKQQLAEKYSKIVQKKFPNRTLEISKCNRDILLVIDSYIDVLRYYKENRRDSFFNTADLISHRFFGPNYQQLKGDISVELEIHKMLHNELNEILTGNPTEQQILKDCVDSLLHKLENGVENYEENLIVKFLKERYQCRAFSKRPVELDKVQILLDALELVPAKQCIQTTRVDVLGPRALVDKEFIYNDTICTLNPTCMNPQIFAPLTFVFSERYEFKELSDAEKLQVPELDRNSSTHDKNRYISLGMSLAVLAITAKSLGLESGFCAAVGPGSYSKEVLKRKTMTDFVFGIGYPREDFDAPRTRLEPDKPKDQYQGMILRTTDYKQSSFSDWIHLRGF
jgi:hypothetical protein